MNNTEAHKLLHDNMMLLFKVSELERRLKLAQVRMIPVAILAAWFGAMITEYWK